MRKFRIISLFMCLIMVFSFAGCNVNVATTSPSATQGTEGTPAPEQTWEAGYKADTISPTGEFVQQPDVRDYTYAWWKNGFRATNGAQLNIQTGYYALSLNPAKGKINTVGAIAEQYSRTEVLTMDEKFIDRLSIIKAMDYAVTLDGARKDFVNVTPIDIENDPTISNCVNGNIACNRMIDNGRYMQTVDIMNLNFRNEKDVTGRVEITATPRYFALEFSIWSKNGAYAKADLEYSITLGDDYAELIKSEDGKVITAREKNGNGLTFVLPDINGASMTLDQSTKTVTITLSGMKVTKREFKGVNVVVIPSVNAKLSDADIYLNNAKVVSSAVQIYPKEGRKQKTGFNTKGVLEISLNNMLTKFGPGEYTDENLDELDRLTFTIENPTDKAIKVPVQFYKTGKYGALGCAPMIRDAQTGEPIGLQVQISKNWHEPVNYTAEDPRMWLSGYWFHGNTYIEVPANSSITYEFCMTYATWGGAFASSHAQISLAGWGGNYQQWDTSSIGSFGEAFCYEPEITHERGFIGDVRALLIYSIWGGGKYSLTENVGGGNFLMYYPASSRQGSILAKTEYRKQGPNLTEVIYSGTTADGKIKYEYTVQLPRTNDVCRAYHSFKYTFVKDTKFTRLAFYQMGADYFNDNKYTSMAIGNDDGTVDITIDGVTYSGQFDTPVYNREQYIGSQNKMQRLDIEGEGLWVAMMGWEPCNYKVAPGSNRMLNLHYYNATINGKNYTKPAISLYHTYDGGKFPCIGVEISPPAECGDTIKAGSVVEGTVEWLNLPVQKDEYYGPSKVIASIPAEHFNTWKAAYAYAVGGKHTVTASVGTVVKNTPAKVECMPAQASGEVVAEITVSGGMGYVPLTFSGVKHYSGYELQVKRGSAWEKVDQSTFGNDYWQTWYDDTKGTYELTFNVEHMGDGASHSYRLVKK